MTVHLSARLAWNDRGWDGCICDEPHLNSSCIKSNTTIRELKNDNWEREFAGTHMAELDKEFPPCSHSPGAYAKRGYKLTHADPLQRSWLLPTEEEIPPYSCSIAPYRWMREEFFRDICELENLDIPSLDKERGWVYEPERQIPLFRTFWNKFEPGESLVFYYCKGNPLDENAVRIIVGVGRLSELGEPLYFNTKESDLGKFPVWPRRVTQRYPEEGVRLPYQEYLKNGYEIENLICRLPQNAIGPFTFVGEHVSDDVAVSVLEGFIQSVQQVQNDNLIPGNWDKHLDWLNDVLAEVWVGRGPLPGLGSVLQYLGFAQGTTYQKKVLNCLTENGQNPWDYVLAVFEGNQEPEEEYQLGLTAAGEKWHALKSRHELLAKLAHFELTPKQVERIANQDKRVSCGIAATEKQITDNPYVIVESDQGERDSEPVALETIDHGMIPEKDAGFLLSDAEKIALDDRRRVRAVANSVLREAAEMGDTVLLLTDLLERVTGRFPQNRICNPDREVVLNEAEYYQENFWTDFDNEPQIISLKYLKDLEQRIVDVVKRRAKKTNPPADVAIDWGTALEKLYGTPGTEKGEAAIAEKETALQNLFLRRLSILTGSAGTGKTTALKVFLNELEKVEGKHPVLLLAPTGKARVRLSTKTGRNAMTIHQLFLKHGWLRPGTFQIKTESDIESAEATTVIIDECSMIPTDILGTLLKALNTGLITRLILVGDPNQLPPIGPGRPFLDIIEWLKENQKECISRLDCCMRTSEDDIPSADESAALRLANAYRQDISAPGDDEILCAVAKGRRIGDIEIEFWNDHDELITKLTSLMENLLGFKRGDYQGFNKSLGISTKDWAQSEKWQILAATRTQHYGTDDLNRLIQFEYNSGLIKMAHNPRSKVPRPFGDDGIVPTDKVIQITNQAFKKGWPRGTGLDYVANGEIGVVRFASKRKGGGDYLDIVYSTQPEVSYRYYRGEVDDNLELGYALTIHKAQGSDFDIVFIIIPQSAFTLSRELIYTGLTRFREKLVLLIEKDITPLLRLRNPNCSDTSLRNTHMFKLTLRPDDIERPHLEALIHRTGKGIAVRSKSEVIVAGVLERLEIGYEYEKPLHSPSDPEDFRLPDFTVGFEGDIFYWEHLGMLKVPSYREAWERKYVWYEKNGFLDRLIISEDGPDGSINAKEIEKTARQKILGE